MGKILIIKGADFSEVKVDTVTPIEGIVSINAIASPAAGGVVTGSGSYQEGTEVEIKALPNLHYNFVKWNDDNTIPTRTIIAGTDASSYTAEFESVEDIEGTLKQGQLYYPLAGCTKVKVTYYNVTGRSTGANVGKSAIRQCVDQTTTGAVVLKQDFNAVGAILSEELTLESVSTYPYLSIWVSYIDYDMIVVEKIA